MYTENVIDRFTNPRNTGMIKNADGVGTVGNPTCGDIMKIYLKVENETIVDAKFKTFGCAAAISSSDVAMDLIKGKTIEEALKVTNKDVLNELGELPAVKIHCSILAQEGIQAAVEDYRKKQIKKALKSIKD
ncbi:MAG: iron-sulfur cluster assembly scaffold protein [Clostridia bacterium]|nr:iron-sulfur cluster assembly scaffold protein [Clostridia bacterium]